ncbi:MAG: SDR family NAD(P)-dependent oxidoreductase [Alkalilacustris sp.]
MNRIDLENRVAVVTGAAQGIGRSVAERMVASGARVAVWDCDPALGAATAADLGGLFVAVDVTDYGAVAAAVAETEAALGGIDILVANAGIAGPNVPVADYPLADWGRVIDINLNGVFHCFRAVVPGMVARGYGRIVATASIAGKEGNPNAGAYSASKAGVIALTKSLGKELAGHDIAVNCVTPAAARTAIFEQMSQTHIDFMLSKIPRGRFLQLDEAAAMICWLASAENSFTTGAVFDLSGGRATY